MKEKIKSLLGVPAPIPYKEKRRRREKKGMKTRELPARMSLLTLPLEASPPPLRRQAFYSLELRS